MVKVVHVCSTSHFQDVHEAVMQESDHIAKLRPVLYTTIVMNHSHQICLSNT